MPKAPPFVNRILSALTDERPEPANTTSQAGGSSASGSASKSPERAIEHVYFPDSGFVSVVADGAPDQHVEVGLIGREGMTGLAVVLGTDRTPNETLVQNAGAGQDDRC